MAEDSYYEDAQDIPPRPLSAPNPKRTPPPGTKAPKCGCGEDNDEPFTLCADCISKMEFWSQRFSPDCNSAPPRQKDHFKVASITICHRDDEKSSDGQSSAGTGSLLYKPQCYQNKRNASEHISIYASSPNKRRVSILNKDNGQKPAAAPQTTKEPKEMQRDVPKHSEPVEVELLQMPSPQQTDLKSGVDKITEQSDAANASNAPKVSKEETRTTGASSEDHNSTFYSIQHTDQSVQVDCCSIDRNFHSNPLLYIDETSQTPESMLDSLLAGESIRNAPDRSQRDRTIFNDTPFSNRTTGTSRRGSQVPYHTAQDETPNRGSLSRSPRSSGSPSQNMPPRRGSNDVAFQASATSPNRSTRSNGQGSKELTYNTATNNSSLDSRRTTNNSSLDSRRATCGSPILARSPSPIQTGTRTSNQNSPVGSPRRTSVASEIHTTDQQPIGLAESSRISNQNPPVGSSRRTSVESEIHTTDQQPIGLPEGTRTSNQKSPVGSPRRTSVASEIHTTDQQPIGLPDGPESQFHTATSDTLNNNLQSAPNSQIERSGSLETGFYTLPEPPERRQRSQTRNRSGTANNQNRSKPAVVNPPKESDSFHSYETYHSHSHYNNRISNNTNSNKDQGSQAFRTANDISKQPSQNQYHTYYTQVSNIMLDNIFDNSCKPYLCYFEKNTFRKRISRLFHGHNKELDMTCDILPKINKKQMLIAKMKSSIKSASTIIKKLKLNRHYNAPIFKKQSDNEINKQSLQEWDDGIDIIFQRKLSPENQRSRPPSPFSFWDNPTAVIEIESKPTIHKSIILNPTINTQIPKTSKSILKRSCLKVTNKLTHIKSIENRIAEDQSLLFSKTQFIYDKGINILRCCWQYLHFEYEEASMTIVIFMLDVMFCLLLLYNSVHGDDCNKRSL